MALLLGLLAVISPTIPGPLGRLALYPAIGMFPGLGVSGVLPGPLDPCTRSLLGLLLAPLVASALGVMLVRGGVPLAAGGVVVAVLGWLVWTASALARARRRDTPSDRRGSPDASGWAGDGRWVIAAALGLALIVGAPLALSEYLRVRGDAWVHASLVWEIVRRGIPPEDPRFAGLELSYVWFYHFFIAQLTALRGAAPFGFMSLFNTVNAALFVALSYRLGLSLWRERTAARGAAALLALGFNAGAWMLWPLGLLPALVGRVRGAHEVASYVQGVNFRSAEIIFSLGAPRTLMVNFLDKFYTSTALNYGYLLFMLHLWALVTWVGEARPAALLLAALTAAGMLFFHGIVGLSVVPVALATLLAAMALRARVRWLPPAGRLAAFAAATLAGALVATPYTLAISSGWSAGRSGLHHQYLGFGALMAWTLASACAVAAWLARDPLRRAFAERRGAAALVALLGLGLVAFACVVRLPGQNETKFAFEAFVPIALLGGAALPATVSRWRSRWGSGWAALWFAALFVVPHALTVVGFSLDPAGRTRPELHPRPGERALYAWIRDDTPVRAVIVDAGFRDLIMVEGQRQLYLGTPLGPEKGAFPLEQVQARRAVVADLYGPGRDIEGDARALSTLARPVYVVFRPEDEASGSPGWRALEARPGRFRAVRIADGYRVYRLVSS